MKFIDVSKITTNAIASAMPEKETEVEISSIPFYL